MFRGILLLGICFIGLAAQSQTRVFEDQQWDFGDVNFWNNDTAWFTVRNGTTKNLIFLPTYYKQDYQIIFNSRLAEPTEIVKIGIIYYSEVKGKFNVAVPMYINQRGEPITFRLKGNIKGFNPMAQLRCPTVNGDASENRLEKVITLEVRDIKTDEQLLPDQINVHNRMSQKIQLEKNKMEFEMAVAPGSFKINAWKKGYEDYEAVITLEPYQLHFIVYLVQKDVRYPDPPQVEVNKEEPIVTNRNPDEGKDTIVVNNIDLHYHRVDSIPKNDPHYAREGELSAEKYKLNNVILIVDVSSSMNRNGKIEALVAAFGSMVDALRPNDKIGVISMSSNAEVVQLPSGVTNKDSLKNKVASIKVIGGTNGGAAIQLAYKLAREHYIPGGNNQIIIATDGVFYGGTLSRREIEALIEKENADGIHMSSVAFGTDPKGILFLENLATRGGGSFVQVVDNYDSNGLLLDMIKSQSQRK